MTGDELKEARTGCNMSREELGSLLGVSAQTIGSWERLGQQHLAMSQPRESAATRLAKQRLPMAMHFMQTASILCLPMSAMVPAPHDWLPILSLGDPLALTDEPAVEGDLVLLRDANGDLATIARVMTEREHGKLMCFTRPYKVAVLPGPDGYKTIGHAICKLHTGIPDKTSWTQVVPPDLV